MKKLKYIIVLFCFIFLLSGCTKEKHENISKNTSSPLLLEVTKKGNDNKLYLFGSIHASKESIYPLPDYVMKAYQNSDMIAVEFDIAEYENNISAQLEVLSRFLNEDDKEIKDYIEEEVYEKGVEILKRVGLYGPGYDLYNPIMWQMLIENAIVIDANLETENGIDKYFLTLSKEDKKKILELESAEEQYNILLSFNYDTQAYLLTNAVNYYEESKTNLELLYDLYKEGDKEELEAFLFSSEESNEYTKEYNEKLITKRNINMTESLEKAFVKGNNIFCTVGLAHIIGEGGIADLFEQKDYNVKIIK